MCTNAQMSSLLYTFCSSGHIVGGPQEGIVTLGISVKAPPMVGPTWTRVRLTLGSDSFPTLFQGTASSLPCALRTVYCSHAHDSMIQMIQGCISTSYLSMSP